MDKEFLESLELPEAAVEAILQQQEEQEKAHALQLRQLRLDHGVQLAVQRHGGRNLKAISALLDMEAIAGSNDVETALEKEMKALKKAHGYLFENRTPPMYARSTGAGNGIPEPPLTLAGALRERMRK